MTHRHFLAAALVLVAPLSYGQPSAPPLSTIENVKYLARAMVTIDQCLVSPDFRKLTDATKRQTVAISNRIDRLANDMHESPKGKLLFLTYNLTLSRLEKSAELRQQLALRQGGVCDFGLFSNINSRLNNIERSVNKHL